MPLLSDRLTSDTREGRVIQHINPSNLLKNPAFSQVVVVEAQKLAFISGQVAMDKHGKVVSEVFADQFSCVLDHLALALDDVGSSWEKIVQLRIYVKQLKAEHRLLIQVALQEIWGSSNPPASTLVGVEQLARCDLKVEIEAIAVV